MIKHIYCDERYPVFYVDDNTGGTQIELTEDEYNRVLDAELAFNKAQSILREKYLLVVKKPDYSDHMIKVWSSFGTDGDFPEPFQVTTHGKSVE